MNNIRTSLKEALKGANETRSVLLTMVAAISGSDPKQENKDQPRVESIETDMDRLSEIINANMEIAYAVRSKLCGDPDQKSSGPL